MTVKRTSNRKASSTLETFRVLYKNGVRDHVQAFTIRFEAKEADRIQFFNSETTENEEIFVRASEVASVIPSSSMVEAPAVAELQNQVNNLTARVDALENNLVSIVTQAVDAAFTKRGL